MASEVLLHSVVDIGVAESQGDQTIENLGTVPI